MSINGYVDAKLPITELFMTNSGKYPGSYHRTQELLKLNKPIYARIEIPGTFSIVQIQSIVQNIGEVEISFGAGHDIYKVTIDTNDNCSISVGG